MICMLPFEMIEDLVVEAVERQPKKEGCDERPETDDVCDHTRRPPFRIWATGFSGFALSLIGDASLGRKPR
jgi:hypothetical protein